MARRFATDIDLLSFAILNAKANPISADPSGLGAGDGGRFWYNSTSGKFKFWNGTAAIDMTDLANSSGSLTASRISDFDTAVRTNRPNQLATPNADLGLGGFKITALADGTAGTDAATFGQLLAFANNQIFKAVRAATTANITLSAPQTVDGVAVVAGDRVLVKDQTTGAANGLYVVAAGAWARAGDADTAAELPPGSVVTVAEGTANGDKLFMLTTNGPITLGTTALAFSPYGASSGEVGVAGAGLTKTGVTYDVGTGFGISVGTDSVAVDTARIARKWSGAVPTATSTVDTLPITVSGAQVTFNHATGNPTPLVVIRAGSSPVAGYVTGEVVEMTDGTVDANNVRVTLPAAPAANNWTFMVVA